MPLAQSDLTIRFGPFEVNPTTGELRKFGSKLKLTGQPFQILILLLEHPGELVTRDQLREKLWPADTFVDFEHGLNTAVKILRQALGDSAGAPRYVETLPRRGYRFVAPVEVPGVLLADPRLPLATEAPRPRRYLPVVLALMFLVVLAAGAVSIARRFSRSHIPQIASLAVLPFQSTSRDSEQEYFTDGVTDELITDLGQVSALRVTSQTSSMHYKGTRKTLSEIANELKVDAVVEGSIERSGNHVRIMARLIRASSDTQLWAKSFDGDVRDILLLQSAVAQDITREIRARITPQEQERLHAAHPVNPAAHEAYLKGRFFWNKFTRQGLNKSIEYFNRAIEIDPTYAPAYVGLADAHIVLGNLFNRPTEEYPKARSAAIEALQLDETLADAHGAMAAIHLFFDWDLPNVQKELDRARELNPNFIRIYNLRAYCLEIEGRMDDSVVVLKQGLLLDPLSLNNGVDLGFAFTFTNHSEDAIKQFRKTLEIEPGSPMALGGLGFAYEQQKDFKSARTEYLEALARDPGDPSGAAFLAAAEARAGHKARARKILRDLEERSRKEFVDPVFLAIVDTGLQDKDAAFANLDRAFEERSSRLIWLNADPVYEELRSDPRFAVLLHRIGLHS